MAKRKFGRYTVDIKKGTLKQRNDNLWESKATITGDIEIGIDIDTMTWRSDWLAQQTFGKEEAGQYILLNIENSYSDAARTVNKVTAVWYKR